MVNRIMIFYDLENFKEGLKWRDRKRKYDYGKVQYLILDLVKNLLPAQGDDNYSLIQAYAYTGEYTESLIKRIKDDMQNARTEEERENLRKILNKTSQRLEAQKSLLEKLRKFHFFELRAYPLKYSNGQMSQKGIDVQLAVDLVTHAFMDNFDIAVVCSRDIDLLESLKIVKSLGKIVVLMSHPRITAKQLLEEADFYIDMSRLSDEDLDRISFGGEDGREHKSS